MKRVIMSVGLAAGLLIACGMTFAHHGRGVAFDEQNPKTLTGTTTKVDWFNPHVFIFFDVKDESGNVTNWGIEWTNPRSLIRLGLNPEMFKPGTVMKMRFIPAKSGAPRGEIQQAWNADGKFMYNGLEGYKGNIDEYFEGAEKTKN